jgi:hypothetical protein
MRLSSRKGAHAGLSNAAKQEIGVLPRCTRDVRAVRFSLKENRMHRINATEFNRRSGQ